MGQGELSLATLGFTKESRSNSQNKPTSPLATMTNSDTASPSTPETPRANLASPIADAGEPEFNLPEFHSSGHKFKRAVTTVIDPTSLVRSGSMTRNRSRKNTGKSLEQPSRSVSSSAISSTLDSEVTHDSSFDDDDDSPEDSNQSGFPDIVNNDHINMTGFAYANPKRNREFHRLFKSVHPDDYLLDDFNCALSKEILIQGKMYVSERHVCFNSNIFGWVTNLVIAFDEIVTMDKKLTAGLFPNGIIIQTLHARHSFASFVTRDSVLDFLMKIWKKASPHQPSRLDNFNSNGVDMSDSESTESTDKGDRDDDSDDEDDNGSFSSYGSSGELISDEMDSDEEFGESARDTNEKEVKEVRKVNGEGTGGGAAGTAGGGGGGGGGGGASAAAAAAASAGGAAETSGPSWPVPNNGPETHSPTDLPPLDSNEKEVASEIISAPIGVVFNMLYGDDSTWIKKFLIENQKNNKLEKIPPFEQEGNVKTRHYEYIRPINGGPVGPKQTRCICTDTIEKFDLENYIIVTTSTQTPDVPSGSSFLTKSKTGLCWGSDNTTKIVLAYHMDWSAKSWLKGPIEKGAHDGQVQYGKDVIAEINNSIKASRGKRKSVGGGGAVKTKKASKRKRKEKKKDVQVEKIEKPTGMLNTIIGKLTETPISIIPLPTWALLTVCLMLYSAINMIFFSTSLPTETERLQLMKVEEEYQMWKWFEDRGRAGYPVIDKPAGKLDDSDVLQYPIFRKEHESSRINGKKGSYSQQELVEAIKITEHRVKLLKERLNI